MNDYYFTSMDKDWHTFSKKTEFSCSSKTGHKLNIQLSIPRERDLRYAITGYACPG
jgi:hypothetical protein